MKTFPPRDEHRQNCHDVNLAFLRMRCDVQQNCKWRLKRETETFQQFGLTFDQKGGMSDEMNLEGYFNHVIVYLASGDSRVCLHDVFFSWFCKCPFDCTVAVN